ncbi:MAG: N4-gp56 family major capsid protein, partial [Clostridia bacterium]
MANSLLNVKVMGEVIGASLPAKLKFAPLAKVDTTLTKVAGDTIVVGKYGYIGEAVKVAPGEQIPISDLSMTSQEVTVAKAGKGVKILDEDVVIRGEEVVTEGKAQLEKAILDKVDSDCLTALQSSKVTVDKSAG